MKFISLDVNGARLAPLEKVSSNDAIKTGIKSDGLKRMSNLKIYRCRGRSSFEIKKRFRTSSTVIKKDVVLAMNKDSYVGKTKSQCYDLSNYAKSEGDNLKIFLLKAVH